MKTLWHQYHEDNDLNPSVKLEDYVGRKVTFDDGSGLYTIINYNDNICGDGCCYGYELEGLTLKFSPSELILVD